MSRMGLKYLSIMKKVCLSRFSTEKGLEFALSIEALVCKVVRAHLSEI